MSRRRFSREDFPADGLGARAGGPVRACGIDRDVAGALVPSSADSLPFPRTYPRSGARHRSPGVGL